MHSVTSGAVYSAINTVTTQTIGWKKNHYGSAIYCKVGKVVFFSASSDWHDLQGGYTYDLVDVPYGYRPIASVKLRETTTGTDVTLVIDEGAGNIYCYNYTGTFSGARNGQYYGCWITNQ